MRYFIKWSRTDRDASVVDAEDVDEAVEKYMEENFDVGNGSHVWISLGSSDPEDFDRYTVSVKYVRIVAARMG